MEVVWIDGVGVWKRFLKIVATGFLGWMDFGLSVCKRRIFNRLYGFGSAGAHYITFRYHDVIMARTQIQLNRRANRSVAAIRGAASSVDRGTDPGRVDQIIEQSDRAARAQRFLKVAGKFSSGLHDVSVNHDKYLAEDFAD